MRNSSWLDLTLLAAIVIIFVLSITAVVVVPCLAPSISIYRRRSDFDARHLQRLLLVAVAPTATGMAMTVTLDSLPAPLVLVRFHVGEHGPEPDVVGEATEARGDEGDPELVVGGEYAGYDGAGHGGESA